MIFEKAVMPDVDFPVLLVAITGIYSMGASGARRCPSNFHPKL
jgi:hypothetical protein